MFHRFINKIQYSIFLTVIFLAAVSLTYETKITTYFFPNYYCDPSLCQGSGPHVACSPPNPFGASCYGRQPQLVVMTAELRAQILDHHNRQRSLLASGKLPGYLPATKMPTLQWDLELQYLAEANARSCEYGHDKCRNTNWSKYVGQNIGVLRFFGLKITKPESIKYFIDAWFNEYVYAHAYVDSYPKYYNGWVYTQLMSPHAVYLTVSFSFVAPKLDTLHKSLAIGQSKLDAEWSRTIRIVGICGRTTILCAITHSQT